MFDEILIWLVCLFPLGLAAGSTLYARPKKARGELSKGCVLLSLASGVIGVIALRWLIGLQHAHLSIRDWRVLLFAPAITLVLFWLQSRSLAGITRGRMWLAFLLRNAIVVLVTLALAGLQMVVERDSLTVLFALDVSKSVPESETNRALDFMRRAGEAAKPNDETGLLVFGGSSAVESDPSPIFEAPALREIKAVVEPGATDIARALRGAGASFDQSSRRRLVLFTDGRETTGSADEEMKRLVSQGVDVWVVPLQASDSAEMLIEKIEAPAELQWEQTFDVNVYVWSNVTANARIVLYPGDASGPARLTQDAALLPGKNRVTFSSLRMHSGGSKQFHAVLEPRSSADDTIIENNAAYAFTNVETNCRILIMTSDLKEVQPLLGALEGEKLEIHVRHPATLPNNPEDFRAYDCIIMANLARGFFSDAHLKTIESCVKDQGAGLIMIGGDQSFGAGGYLGTPIESALPVEMDLDNQKLMPKGALLIVLDASGSMGEMASNTMTKQQVANSAAVGALLLLSPKDLFGIISFDGRPETVVRLGPNIRPEASAYLIKSIAPGGGTEIYPALVAARDMFKASPYQDAAIKHIILMTDGQSQPGDYASVLKDLRNDHITISTVGVGHGHDAKLLKYLAADGHGRYFPADDPRKLPQIFIKEAAVVRKSLIHADDRGIPIALGVAGTTLKEFGTTFPSVRAMVMTKPKLRSELQLYAVISGEKMPVLTSWHYGLGQSAAFTPDSSTRWAPDWVGWQGYKKFWTNVIRGVSRQHMPFRHAVTARIENGQAHVTVEAFDDRGDYVNFSRLSGVAVPPSGTKGDNDAEPLALNFQMTQPGRYEARFPIGKPGTYPITIVDSSNPKQPQSIVTGVAHSYSAEYSRAEKDAGMLQRLAEIAAGTAKGSHLKELSSLSPVDLYAHDLPAGRRPTDLFEWLLIAALCLFPLDVAVRRLALDPEPAMLRLNGALMRLLPALGSRWRLRTADSGTILSPGEIVPSGAASREAQGRYERIGESKSAASFDLNPTEAANANGPHVGGTKVTPRDMAASAYTEALLRAKKRAKRK